MKPMGFVAKAKGPLHAIITWPVGAGLSDFAAISTITEHCGHGDLIETHLPVRLARKRR
ncbi:hypothetical protein GCM10007920_18520 [Ciceribacter naphthalenivorans]|nr:hypothetical protein GCM10007920_18520 [Ciceribacter naphthalenivorans]GLT04921.1 hypothetical protein GCM10007926_18520 [Sphingomonas psychrolutea]